MLLDDTQVAINDLLAALQESLEHYADALERIDSAALRERLDGVVAARRDDVDCLAGIVRDAGDLPRAPSADRQELHRLVTHVKAALTDDETRVLLDDRIEDEKRLGSLAAEALRQDLGADARACVERIGAHSDEARARLADAGATG